MRTPIVTMLLLMTCSCIFPDGMMAEEGYMPPGSIACGGISNMVLIYAGGKNRLRWSQSNLMPYVAYIDKDGAIKDSFFDAFLFLETTSRTGGMLSPRPLTSGRLAVKEDWEGVSNELFIKDENLDALDKAKARLKTVANDSLTAKVVIFIPYPDFRQSIFGDIDKDKTSENLTKTEDRFKAVSWYIDRILGDWKESKYKNLELTGFYWMSESISNNQSDMVYSQDPILVKQVSDYIHLKGYRLYWIPYFNSSGRLKWKDYGIDCAFFQPNYYFSNIEKERIENAADIAKAYRMGIEIEFDKRIVSAPEFAVRYKTYLDGGVDYGYLKGSAKAYYEGGGGLLEIYRAKERDVRLLYDATYYFVKGRYSKISDEPLDK